MHCLAFDKGRFSVLSPWPSVGKGVAEARGQLLQACGKYKASAAGGVQQRAVPPIHLTSIEDWNEF